MSNANVRYIVNTDEGEEVGISKDKLYQLADMSDWDISNEGYIPQSVRDEYNRHFGRKHTRTAYSVIVVATQTAEAGKYDYAAFHLEREGGTLVTTVWKGLDRHEKYWQRTIHFVVNPDMSWGILSDSVGAPYCWRTNSEVFVSCELYCDEVANNMLDTARAVAYPEEYIAWSAELERRECEAVRAKSK